MDYKQFAADWGIIDDENTRRRIIRADWSNPGQYSSRNLLAIGQIETAKRNGVACTYKI